MAKSYSVYMHIFPNGKKYIGITKQSPKDRWRAGYNQIMENAIAKYGWQNVKHEIVADNLTQDEAESIERRLIKENKTTNREYGYNILPGAPTAGMYPKTTKQRMSKAHKGRKHTDATIEKIRKWNIGRKMTEEAKVKNGNAHKKPVVCIETKTEYDCARSASAAVGVSPSSISCACIGKTKTSAGYHWKFKEV